MYDLLAGKENMESSYLMSKGKALETFPMLKQNGLVGALVYYDGTWLHHRGDGNYSQRTRTTQRLADEYGSCYDRCAARGNRRQPR